MRIEENTYQLNIRILGKNDDTARVQVEELEPMTRDEFWEFLLRASKADQLPASCRPSRAVWRDTKESPQPKSVLKAMDEFNKVYKSFKRKFPQASNKLLEEKTRQYIDQRKTIFEDFQAALTAQLSSPEGSLFPEGSLTKTIAQSKQASRAIDTITSLDKEISDLLSGPQATSQETIVNENEETTNDAE